MGVVSAWYSFGGSVVMDVATIYHGELVEDTIQFDSGHHVRMDGVVIRTSRPSIKGWLLRRCFAANGGGMTTSRSADIATVGRATDL